MGQIINNILVGTQNLSFGLPMVLDVDDTDDTAANAAFTAFANKTYTFAAGTLQVGDVIEWTAHITGTAGTPKVGLTFGATTSSAGLTTATGTWSGVTTGRAIIWLNAGVYYAQHVLRQQTGSTDAIEEQYFQLADITTNSNTLTLKGKEAAANAIHAYNWTLVKIHQA